MKQSIILGICVGVLTCIMSLIQPRTSMANQSEEEMTVATVDIYSIPEEYRTVDNFGPAFKESGVPVDRVEGIDLVVNVEENVSVETTPTPIVEPIIESSSKVIEVGIGSTAVETSITSEASTQLQVTPPPSNRWGISLNEEEINVLAKILWKEARGESDEGEQAVVEVVFNRMYSPNYPSTCIGVLSQRRQFSTWPGYESGKPSEKEFRNIQAVLNGESNILPYETVFFSTKPQNRRIQLHLGGHYFCNQ